jgi:hypothetical protein
VWGREGACVHEQEVQAHGSTEGRHGHVGAIPNSSTGHTPADYRNPEPGNSNA